MHWEILIIPLIALGVWILGTLFKPAEDDKMKKGVRRPGSVSGRGPGRRPVTDLDRFLEEARRREAEDRPKPPPPPAPARPTTPRPSQRPALQRETPPVAPPVVRRGEAPRVVSVARPVAQPARAEPVLVAASSRDEPPPPPPAPTTTRPTQPSPILQQVRSLLSKPQSAGAAFVLREIFDRPLTLRRR